VASIIPQGPKFISFHDSTQGHMRLVTAFDVTRHRLCGGPDYVEDQIMWRTRLCGGPDYVEDRVIRGTFWCNYHLSSDVLCIFVQNLVFLPLYGVITSVLSPIVTIYLRDPRITLASKFQLRTCAQWGIISCC